MSRFDYFIVLAEMRTGSNFLEANINTLDGVTCHGEAFNPAFIGYPKSETLLGLTLQDRTDDPQRLIAAIREDDGLAGFRYFNDHDPRILNACLTDPRCAKIILTRNPVDSFVSWKIAQTTGQWKLTNATHSKSNQITFEAEAFETHLETIQAFQLRVLNTLQKTGQSAFYIGYDDLHDLEVLNGLAMFLGIDSRLSNLNKKLKKQNPEPLSDRVLNFDEMQTALARLDRFDLSRTPNFEPRRGPAIPTYLAAAQAPLLYMPLRSGPDAAVMEWLGALDGVTPDGLQQNFSQKTLRQWQQDHPHHRSFAVLRHPLARAHAAFCDCILFEGPGSFPRIRATLRKVHKLPIPAKSPGGDYSEADHKAAFLGFLKFLRNNLSGQTNIRVDPHWASQLALLQGMTQFALPDMILREDHLTRDLSLLAQQIGRNDTVKLPDPSHPQEHRLASIYDDALETAAKQAYQRDYVAFGFGDWA